MNPKTFNSQQTAAENDSTARQAKTGFKRLNNNCTSETWRVFIAVTLDERQLARISQLQHQLRAHLPEAPTLRWTNAAGFHLTLRFVGDIAPTHVEPLCEATSRACTPAATFQLHLTHLGCFPSRRNPRVLWAGVGGDLDALHKLHSHVARETAGFGIPPENRSYQPHLTLARIKDGHALAHSIENVFSKAQSDQAQSDQAQSDTRRDGAAQRDKWPQRHGKHHPQHHKPQTMCSTSVSDSVSDSWTVREIALIRSVLSPAGARYQTLATFPLTAVPLTAVPLTAPAA